jgi:alginate O-acetyltransferase complex protein AlgI
VLFNSLSFLGSFVVFAVVYYAIDHRLRWILLTVASLGFYALFSVVAVAALLAVTGVTYVGGLAIGRPGGGRWRRRAVLASAVTLVSSVLVYSKFFGSFGTSVGVSFYTLSCVSYLVDIHAGRLGAERHPGYLTLYVAFFPKLLAGPIERARPFLAQVRQPVIFSDPAVSLGLWLMLWGLFKKVVIADRLARFVDVAYAQPAFASPADLLIATYFFAFQLYCDFSGYSDIAIGAARVLGFDLMANFRRPYLSTSVREFWAHRWHLSLSAWFRDYVYIPMGGSRAGVTRQLLSVMVVFLLSGVWHGTDWTFVIWGGLNGAYVVASILIARLWPPTSQAAGVGRGAAASLRRVCTFHLILVTWVFFRAASLSDAETVLVRIGQSAVRLPGLVMTRIASVEVAVSLMLIAGLLLAERAEESRPLWAWLAPQPVQVRWAAYYALLLALVVMGVWNVRQFVYMQF